MTWYKEQRHPADVHSGDISEDHTADRVVGRVFVRMYQMPAAPAHPAYPVQGRKLIPVARHNVGGRTTLQLAYGEGSEGAQWYDPTDPNADQRKIVFP